MAESFEEQTHHRVELTDEREAHIRRFHPDAVPFLGSLAEVLRTPDVRCPSTQDSTVVVYYKYFAKILGGKYVAVVVKTNDRWFVLTAYLTRRLRTGMVR